MSIGSQLRAAREKKNLTRSQVAAATRMKVQTVEALEDDDYKQIPAPIYAKGFIKSYAELVGLDVKALMEEYVRLSASPKPAPAVSGPVPAAPPKPAPAPVVAPKPAPAPVASVAPGPEVTPSPLPPAATATVPASSSLSRPTPRFGHVPASSAGPAPAPAPVPEPVKIPEKCVSAIPCDPERDIDTQRPSGGGMTFGRLVWLSIGLGVLLVFLISSLSRCAGPARSTSHPPAVTE